MNINLEEQEYWIIWHSLILEEEMYKNKMSNTLYRLRVSEYEYEREMCLSSIEESEKMMKKISLLKNKLDEVAKREESEWFKCFDYDF